MIKPETEENIITISGQDSEPPVPTTSKDEIQIPSIITLLSPLHLCLRCIGAVLPTSKENPKLKIYNNLVLESVTLQVIMALVNSLADILAVNQDNNFFDTQLNLMMVITSLCSLHLMQKSYSCVMDTLQEYCFLIQSNEKSCVLIKNCSKLFSLFGCFHSLILLSYEESCVFAKPIEDTAQKLPYGLRELGVKCPPITLLVVSCQRFVYCVFVQSAITHYISFLALMCFYMSQIFTAFTQETSKKLADLKENDYAYITNMCNLYLQLCDSVRKINHIFSDVVFFWVGYGICRVALLLKFIVKSVSKEEDWVTVDLPISVACLSSILALCLSANSMTKSSASMIPVISTYLSNNVNCKQEIYNVCKMILDKMMFDRPVLKAWECININKSLIVLASAIIFAYTVVLLQMNY